MKKALFLLCSVALLAQGPMAKKNLPWVSSGFIPCYPPSARAEGVSGTVVIEVETDGVRVIKSKVISGPPLLAEPVQEFVESWGFYPHRPTKFETRFAFSLTGSKSGNLDGGEMRLRLPYSAKISMPRYIKQDMGTLKGEANQ